MSSRAPAAPVGTGTNPTSNQGYYVLGLATGHSGDEGVGSTAGAADRASDVGFVIGAVPADGGVAQDSGYGGGGWGGGAGVPARGGMLGGAWVFVRAAGCWW